MKTMNWKNKLMKLGAAALVAALPASAATADGINLAPARTADTIEVQFGDRGRIRIEVGSKEDLEALKRYDVNGMLRDIELEAGTTPDSVQEVSVEDPEGTRYLLDSIAEKEEFRALEREFEGSGNSQSSSSGEWKSTKKSRGAGTRFVEFMDFGFNNYLDEGSFPNERNAPYTVKSWGSWYVALAPAWQTHIGGRFALNYGAGVSWYNFKFQDPTVQLTMGEDGVIFDNFPADQRITKSKLTTSYIQAKLIPMLDFGYRPRKKVLDDGTVLRSTGYKNSRFRIGVGPYAGYRIGGHTKIVDRTNGGKDKTRVNDHFFLTNFRYGLRLQLGISEVDFFVNYDFNTLFADQRGPKLNAFSFGVTF
jgi:hypothetical protein